MITENLATLKHNLSWLHSSVYEYSAHEVQASSSDLEHLISLNIELIDVIGTMAIKIMVLENKLKDKEIT